MIKALRPKGFDHQAPVLLLPGRSPPLLFPGRGETAAALLLLFWLVMLLAFIFAPSVDLLVSVQSCD